MDYQVNFGQLTRKSNKAAAVGKRFRLAVLGDFSGRANAGLLETGEDLAKRKPISVDVDNLDDVLARMSLKLSLDLGEESVVEVPLAAIDDFHPDQLVDNVELFETMRQLRRDLGSKAGFARASKEVLSWSGEAPLPRRRSKSRGASIATDSKLSDFARLTGRAKVAAAESSVDDLVRRLVGPYVVPTRDARQDVLTGRVDEALSAAMRRVLHHPDFQTAEALWRSVELLVRRIETGATMQIVLYDVSAEELAADIAATEALEETGLYGMLVEQPALDANQGALSAVVGLYGFELSPPHADLLGRIAQIAAAARAPFVASIAPDDLQTPMHKQNPLITDAWTALMELPEAAYLGLATPRFLLRTPYGKKSDPIDAFAFEEFTREGGLSGMLWANPAVAFGLLVSQSWLKGGAKMKPNAVSVIGDMPYYVYVAPDGDQVALPCTERLYSERQAAQVGTYHVMPVISLRGRPEVRLAGVASLAGAVVAGFWAPPDLSTPAVAEAAAAPEAEAEDAGESASDSDEAAADGDAGGGGGDTDLDALLAGLSEPEPAAAEGETEIDLDALLASL